MEQGSDKVPCPQDYSREADLLGRTESCVFYIPTFRAIDEVKLVLLFAQVVVTTWYALCAWKTNAFRKKARKRHFIFCTIFAAAIIIEVVLQEAMTSVEKSGFGNSIPSTVLVCVYISSFYMASTNFSHFFVKITVNNLRALLKRASVQRIDFHKVLRRCSQAMIAITVMVSTFVFMIGVWHVVELKFLVVVSLVPCFGLGLYATIALNAILKQMNLVCKLEGEMQGTGVLVNSASRATMQFQTRKIMLIKGFFFMLSFSASISSVCFTVYEPTLLPYLYKAMPYVYIFCFVLFKGKSFLTVFFVIDP